MSASNLANLVTELRSALGDDARKPRIIRTVPRFGYAFQRGRSRAADRRVAGVPTPFVCRLVWGPREIALDPGENLIGRDRDSVVWIDDASVSRRHARIVVDDRRSDGRRSRQQERDVRPRPPDRRAGAARGPRRDQDRAGIDDLPPLRRDRLDGLHGRDGRTARDAPRREPGSARTRCSARSAPAGWGRSIGPATSGSRATSRSRCCRARSPPTRGRLDRFEKEARAASSLNHPNIVTIYDIGSSDSIAYIAMELVEGKTLRELLVAGPAPLRRLLSLAAQIADGLAKAHAAGIVHRDLKPENLMVTRDGFVKILDFGLAKLVPGGFESSEGTHLATVTRGTEPGTVMGTVGYMSPEQASGHPVDFRSDQFSLGAILYEMAAGKRAFERSTAVQTLSAIIQDEPEPLGRRAEDADQPRLDRRALPRQGSGGPVRLDEGPRARSRRPARPRLRHLGLRARAAGRARRFRPSRAPGSRPRLWRRSSSRCWRSSAARGVQARRDREAPPPRRRTLTFRRGFLTGARFAPDGQTIVYSAAWDGKPSEIFTTRVGSSESRSARHLPGGHPGDLLGRRDGHFARLREPLGPVLRNARPRAARRRRAAGDPRRRELGRLVAGRQGARRRSTSSTGATASSIRSERCSTRPTAA